MNDENERSGADGGSVDELGPVPRATDTGIRLSLLRWTPVTERLPEAGQTVMLWNYVDHRLGWLKYTANGVAYFFSTQDECNIEPTHWMPLPAPPTGRKGRK